MIKINTKKYIFCPYCGQDLKTKMEEQKERQWCDNCRWTHYPHVGMAVGGLIIVDDRILLAKRNREPYIDTWTLPAGFVDYGEHPEETLIREVKEETGLDVCEFEHFTIEQSPDDPRSPGHFTTFYLVTKYTGEITNGDKDENNDLKWFSTNDLPTIGWESHRKALKLLLGDYQNTIS